MKYSLKIRRWIRKIVHQRWRNQDKQKAQTHLRQKHRKLVRPANVIARRTAIYKYRFGIQ